MKSIKPGRGPSGMSFIGSVFVVIFGIFWTAMAVQMTANAPIPGVGIIFPLFGVVFVMMGILQAVYHLKNATGKNRFSDFDITDESEEKDPLNEWAQNQGDEPLQRNNYCPGCGEKLEGNYDFCPRCGRRLNS